MITQVFFVQGGGKGAHAEDEKLATSLQAKLGAGYKMIFPKMSNESSPDYKTWKKDIADWFAKMGREPVLVGHSVGGAILLKYLSEEPMKVPVAGLFILAAPYVNANENWRDDAAALKPGFDSKLSSIPHILLYHCRDDEIVPFCTSGALCCEATTGKDSSVWLRWSSVSGCFVSGCD